jgi:hypothetical protein
MANKATKPQIVNTPTSHKRMRVEPSTWPDSQSRISWGRGWCRLGCHVDRNRPESRGRIKGMPILSRGCFITAVHLASLEGVWRCVSNGSCWILSVFVYVESTWIQSTFMCLQVGIFRSTLPFIGGDCWSDALFLWGFSMMTLWLSTTTRFALRKWQW